MICVCFVNKSVKFYQERVTEDITKIPQHNNVFHVRWERTGTIPSVCANIVQQGKLLHTQHQQVKLTVFGVRSGTVLIKQLLSQLIIELEFIEIRN